MTKRVEEAKRVSGLPGSTSPTRTEAPPEDRADERPFAAEETARTSTLEDEIRLRAYYRYLEREGESGDATSDWLEAESDVLGRHATGVDADAKVRDDPRS